MIFGLNKAVTDKLNALKQTTLSGHFINNNSLTEADLARKFASPQKYLHNVTFEFTTDKNLLQQYYNIRENAYRSDLGLKDFSGQQDWFDKNSYILVAKAGPKVVGGVRLTVSSAVKNIKLPLESQGYNLREYFPNIDFAKTTYFETSRMAFLPEFRSGRHVLEMCKRIAEFYINAGAYVGFAIAPVIQAKRYKTIINNLGFRAVIREDVKLPKVETYADIQPLLCASDFSSDARYAHLIERFDTEEAENVEHELELA